MDTVLTINGLPLTPYAVRGLRQSLEPIEQTTAQRRTVNGALIDLSVPALRKYRSVIEGDDMQPPALDGVWPGATVTVECLAELSYLTSGGSPARSVVSGSSYVEGDFTFYRPSLTMMVVGFGTNTDEPGARVGWSLELAEV